MSASGNHEAANSVTDVQWKNNDIDYGVDGVQNDGYGSSGAYYSFDYAFAHFVVLNSNDTGDAQVNWLKADLAAAQSSKWIIVTLHNGPYATGDHSNLDATKKIITTYTPVFSQYHVDLVLQAHDHTYNKTLPYKWDAAGYTTTYNNESVVNFHVDTLRSNGVNYDLNPNGTYYVTTGAAGHRVGELEKADGVWADVTGTRKENNISGVISKSFLNNDYKIEVGEITQSNQYAGFAVDGNEVKQNFSVGDPATANVNAQMFGVLELTEDTLTYSVYTVNGNDVNLFDTLNVMKTNG